MWAHQAELPSREVIHCLPQPAQLPSVDTVGMWAPHIECRHLSMPLQNFRVDADPQLPLTLHQRRKNQISLLLRQLTKKGPDFSAPQWLLLSKRCGREQRPLGDHCQQP